MNSFLSINNILLSIGSTETIDTQFISALAIIFMALFLKGESEAQGKNQIFNRKNS